MEPQRTTAQSEDRPRGWPILVLAAAGPALYAAGLSVAAVTDVQSLGQAVCFDPGLASHLVGARAIAAVVMALGAVLLLWITPWLLGMLAVCRIEGKRATAHAWSLAANTAALVLVCLILRNTVGIDRGSFLAAWLTWTAVLLILTGPSASSSAAVHGFAGRFGIGAAIGVFTVALGMVLFHGEHFLQCFNGDGTEFHELARSLGRHLLPYWEIEPTGQHGTFIANPTVTNSYWTLALQMLLGSGEVAARLPCWIWWLGVFVVALPMTQAPATQSSRYGAPCSHGRCAVRPAAASSTQTQRTMGPTQADGTRSVPATILAAVALALMLLLMCIWYTFYVGYDPYMADPANPGVPDALFTLLLLLSLDCLRRGDTAGWVASMVCAALLFYAGWVMFALTAASAILWGPVDRRVMVRATLQGAAILAVVVLFYLVWGWFDGSWSAWPECLQMEWLDKYFAPEPRLRSSVLFLGYFVLGCGGIPALGLLAAFRRSCPWQRTVATVAVVYLAIILGSGLKNLHYLGPLLPLPLILWLRSPARMFEALGRRAAPLMATASLAICIWLCWPLARPIFTLNRQLGAMTSFRTNSYEEACLWGRISEELHRQGRLGWEIGQHTWVGYAQCGTQPARMRPLLVTDGEAPTAHYRLVLASTQGGRLYGLDPGVLEWMAGQRPATRAERWPRVLRPLAGK